MLPLLLLPQDLVVRTGHPCYPGNAAALRIRYAGFADVFHGEIGSGCAWLAEGRDDVSTHHPMRSGPCQQIHYCVAFAYQLHQICMQSRLLLSMYRIMLGNVLGISNLTEYQSTEITVFRFKLPQNVYSTCGII